MSEEYAAADIEFLDRETGKKYVYCYPVTRIRLRGMENPEEVMHEFRVVNGEWVREGNGKQS